MPTESLHAWIRSIAARTQPASVRLCDGTESEALDLEERMVREGTLTLWDEYAALCERLANGAAS